MALYIPAGRRRRRTALATILALALGLGLGAVAGRVAAPTVGDQVRATRADARATAAGLRVLVLHDESGALANDQGDGGAGLVLQRTRKGLTSAFAKAPWLGARDRTDLLDELDTLVAMPQRTSPAFGTAAESLAAHIDATFARP